MSDKSTSLVRSLVPFIWMVFVWCALWQDFGVPNLAFGAILSALALAVFRLPTLFLSNRFNPWYALVFAVYLLWEIMVASVQLFWLACTFKKPLRNSVVAVQLRTNSDLWLTAISHSMSLIPGSVVVEVDRHDSVLFFHVVDCKTPADAEKFRAQAHRLETMILKAVGSKEEYAMIKNVEAQEEAAEA